MGWLRQAALPLLGILEYGNNIYLNSWNKDKLIQAQRIIQSFKVRSTPLAKDSVSGAYYFTFDKNHPLAAKILSALKLTFDVRPWERIKDKEQQELKGPQAVSGVNIKIVGSITKTLKTKLKLS